MYKNNEGYADPTAGAALNNIWQEARNKKTHEMLRAAKMVIQHKELWEIAQALGCSHEYARALLRDLLDTLNRATKEMI